MSRVILWGVSLSIMLVVLAAGMEDNAVSHWVNEGNTLFSQGNIPGAIKCYDKAIGLGNQTNAPLLTGIITQCGYRMDAVEKKNSTQASSKIWAGPTFAIKGQPNPDPDAIFLSFDVTNPNDMHMRISNIYVNVIKYNSIANPKFIHNFGVGHNRGYFCSIEPMVGSYKCALTSKDYDFIDLGPTDIECIVINVGTDAPGAYELKISLDYSIGGETDRITVDEAPLMIGFFNRDATAKVAK